MSPQLLTSLLWFQTKATLIPMMRCICTCRECGTAVLTSTIEGERPLRHHAQVDRGQPGRKAKPGSYPPKCSANTRHWHRDRYMGNGDGWGTLRLHMKTRTAHTNRLSIDWYRTKQETNIRMLGYEQLSHKETLAHGRTHRYWEMT